MAIVAIVKKAKTRPRKASEPRKLPTQGRAKVTVDAILEATARILRTSGFEGLTTNKVAEAAGVSVGSLYQYFPGKDALVTALLIERGDRQNQILLSALAAAKDEPIEVVVDVAVRTLMELGDNDPDLAYALITQLSRVSELGDIVRYVQTKVSEPIHAFLVMRKGDLVVEDLEAAAFVLSHAIQPLLQHLRASGKADQERKAVYAELSRMITVYLTGKAPTKAQR